MIRRLGGLLLALAPAENVPQGVSLVSPRSWSALLADLDAEPELRWLLAEAGVLSDWREALVFSERSRSGIASLASRLAGRAIDARFVAVHADLAHARLAAGESYMVTGPCWRPAGEDDGFAALTRLWRDASHPMIRPCAADGIRFVHVLRPNQYGGHEPLGEDEQAIAFDPRHPYAAPARRGYPLLRLAGSTRAW